MVSLLRLLGDRSSSATVAVAAAKASATSPEMMIIRLFLVLATLLPDIVCQHQRTVSPVVKDAEVITIEAVAGESVYIPCNLTISDTTDNVSLILWYRQDKGTPVYSFDIRDRDAKSAKRWSDETVFGNRAYFIFDKQPGQLAIQHVRDEDTGLYRCRVDFQVAQTRNSIVNLTVIVPPEQVVIRDETNTERPSVIGPYSENDSVKITCTAYGGKPRPKLSWYRDGNLIESVTKDVSGGQVKQSEISLGPLRRSDLNSKLSCRAINHPSANPLEATVQIDMNFAPLNVKLLGAQQPLSAGRKHELLCQSSGSRPPAVITWWRDGQRLDTTTETTSSDGNQTTSTLSIVLSHSDANKYLSCRAYNHAVPAKVLEDRWRLDIQYVPETSVRLGSSLDPNSIHEGMDLYFDCIVNAHPVAYKVEWRHNGYLLAHNQQQGVIISNHSLVIQGVSRTTAGNYSCVGFNAEGQGTSPPFQLNVLYAPTCAPNQPRVYGIAKHEAAQIKCVVDANPPDVEFKWTFNNSAESIDVTASHVSRYGTQSVVSYKPMTELDYGTLLCSATNRIGKQKTPCFFHIIAAGRPDQVHNCTIMNISTTSINIKCSEGFNGGLTQSFSLEVRESQTQELKANFTSSIPRFVVGGLHPGGVYTISINAFNVKGRSEAVDFQAAMLGQPEKQLTEQPERPKLYLSLTPTISIAIGIASALLIGGCAILIGLRLSKCKKHPRHHHHHHHRQNNGQSDAQRSLKITSKPILYNGSPGSSNKSGGSHKDDDGDGDEKNPDVIPDSSEEQLEYLHQGVNHISTIDPNSSACNPLHRTYSSSMVHHMGTLGHRNNHHGGHTLMTSRGAGQMHPALQMAPPNHIYSTMTRVPRHLINASHTTAASLQPLVQPMSLQMQPPQAVLPQGQLLQSQQQQQQQHQHQQQHQQQSNLGSLVPMVSY